MKKTLSALALALCLAASAASALDLGDAAPAITPAKWITGEAGDPTVVDGKTFYIVEVWSVTCPPCVMTIPIMNDIQKRYAAEGLKIISFTTDAEEDVTPFLAENPMEYASFLDKEGGSTINYMAADNRTTIPHAFLFDKEGALVWIGNPLDNLEERVKDVLSGKLNKDWAVKSRTAKENLEAAFENQDMTGMLESLQELERLEPANGQYYQLHYRILTELGGGNESDITALLNTWFTGAQNDAESLVVLSMLAMDQGHPGLRNPGLALTAARKAYALESDLRLQAGLNLADTYKAIGRIDLAKATVAELQSLPESAEEKAVLDGIITFYTRLEELAKNPDADYAP